MKLKRYITLLVLLLIALVVLVPGSGAHSFRIVADQSVEDIVVTCVRSRRYLIPIHSTRYAERYRTLVVSSGKPFSCGLNVLGSHSRLEIAHPTYIVDREEAGQDVDQVIYLSPGLGVIDALEGEYAEGGESLTEDEREALYRRSIHTCSRDARFMERYLEGYAKVAALDYQQMKQRYHAESRRCIERAAELWHRLGRVPAGYYVDETGRRCDSLAEGRCPDPEFRPQAVIDRTMERAWNRELWYPHLRGTEGERNRNLGMKYTYLVELRDEDGYGATWLLMDAYSSRDITAKYPDFRPHRAPPTWMSESRRDRYTRDCDGTPLHWDIDEEPTGWLKHYAAGDVRDIVCR